jgi:hypothetical protein
MPHASEIPGSSGPSPVSLLLAEATDMTFGSTLLEQRKFTGSLTEWVAFSFPTEVPQGSDCGHSIAWDLLFEVVVKVSSWIPKLCLTLQISDIHNASKREKMALSVDVACKQIGVVERVLLYACTSGHSEALATVVSCVWAAPDKADAALLLSDGSGLLACLDQLATAGTYVDTFLSLKLQFQIVHTLCRLLQHGSRDVVHALLDCGILRSVSLFLQCVVDTVLQVTKLSQLTTFTKEYKTVFSTVTLLWETLLSLKDERVVEEMIDSGVIQKLAEEWLPCSQAIALVQSSDIVYNPLMVRSMALGMMERMFRKDLDSGPGSVRLSSEMTRWLVTTGAVSRELHILQSTSSIAPKKTSKLSLTNANSRRTAADVLIAIARATLQRMDQEMTVH